MKSKAALLVVLALLLSGARASSTVLIPQSFDELIAKAETIFLGRVVDRRAEWEVTRDGQNIVTVVTFDVERVLKGRLGTRTQLTFAGGTIGDVTMSLGEIPEFQTGDRDVLFVSGTVRAVSPIVGFSQGRFRVVRDSATGGDQVRLNDGRPLVNVESVGKTAPATLLSVRPMGYSQFESIVQQKVALLRAR